MIPEDEAGFHVNLPLEWDEANIAHIQRHSVEPTEAEEVLINGPFGLEEQFRKGEKRLSHLGVTHAGRVLVVVTTRRGEYTRVVTAFDANRNMRKYYVQLQARQNAKNH